MSTLIAEGFAAWRECRDAYDELLHAQYQAAEEATHGAMLNAAGKEKGLDPFRLFRTNALFRGAYASDELLEHWRDHPHVTFAAFERQWSRVSYVDPADRPFHTTVLSLLDAGYESPEPY